MSCVVLSGASQTNIVHSHVLNEYNYLRIFANRLCITFRTLQTGNVMIFSFNGWNIYM